MSNYGGLSKIRVPETGDSHIFFVKYILNLKNTELKQQLEVTLSTLSDAVLSGKSAEGVNGSKSNDIIIVTLKNEIT